VFLGSITTSNPQIINLLEDGDSGVHCVSVEALAKFSEHGM
jgi:hypothetical protein